MTLIAAQGDLRWTQTFIGLPFADKGRDWTGCDCWGFNRLVHKEHAGNDLPSYDGLYVSSAEQREIAGIVAHEAQSPLWQIIGERDGKEFHLREQPRELDIIWLRRGRLDAHCGLFLRPGLMLHMVEHDCSKIERYDDGPPWAGRVTGIYRWRGA
ncbi:NlpC/P60 family protein [Mesorhizobium sp. M0968]|uniref:NlpC/P60 family protein n=1 Tax=Mesorhizobium sp. M0968 TaxID=2957037 RepID=UPI00333D2309